MMGRNLPEDDEFQADDFAETGLDDLDALEEIPEAIGQTLVGTVVTKDKKFIRACMAAGHIDRLNVGPIETFKLSWDQPHEGNLFQLLYRQRAFQLNMPDEEAMAAFP